MSHRLTLDRLGGSCSCGRWRAESSGAAESFAQSVARALWSAHEREGALDARLDALGGSL